MVKCGEFMYIKCLVQRMNQGMFAVLIRARARALPSSPAWDPAQSGSPVTSGLGSIKRPPSGPEAVLPALHFVGATRGGNRKGLGPSGRGRRDTAGAGRGQGQGQGSKSLLLTQPHVCMHAFLGCWGASSICPHVKCPPITLRV